MARISRLVRSGLPVAASRDSEVHRTERELEVVLPDADLGGELTHDRRQVKVVRDSVHDRQSGRTKSRPLGEVRLPGKLAW